jgi:hypothetical protein
MYVSRVLVSVKVSLAVGPAPFGRRSRFDAAAFEVWDRADTKGVAGILV